jgi:hypothetical protein
LFARTFTRSEKGTFNGTLSLNVVKLEQQGEDGATHIVLWEPRDR